MMVIGSKRRRSRAELEELRREEQQRIGAAEAREAYIEQLEGELRQSKRKSDSAA